jgi:hypothetical protein
MVPLAREVLADEVVVIRNDWTESLPNIHQSRPDLLLI